MQLELAYFSGCAAEADGGAGVVLRFERVRPRRPARFQPLKSQEITPKFLDRTIRALKRWKYDIVSMDEVCRRAVTLAAPRRFVCLTFDGGYKDLITSAYPVLSRHGVPFTIYVPTAFPDGLGEAWWLALEEVIARENRLSLVMDRKERHFNIGNTSEKYQLYEFLEGWMRSLAPPDLSSAIKDLCTRYSVDLAGLSRDASMDWDDLAKLAADPMVTIGSATVNYPVLTSLKDADALREMTMGRAVAQAAFHRDVRHFAYPFGDREPGAGSMRQWRRRPVLPARHRRYRASSRRKADQSARAAAHRLGRTAAFAARHARDAFGRHLPAGEADPEFLKVRPRHPADDRHRRQHPADAGHDIEDRLQQPELASHGVCASVIPISDHTTTSTSRAMVPKNLRVRMVMAEMCRCSRARLRAGRGGL